MKSKCTLFLGPSSFSYLCFTYRIANVLAQASLKGESGSPNPTLPGPNDNSSEALSA